VSKRILVVEDQEDSRRILRDLLSSADYEMTEAENGEEALASVAKQRPDLILMDIRLSILDGCEARAASRPTRVGGQFLSSPSPRMP
jgi:two-component system cell cycle response regulator DivK